MAIQGRRDPVTEEMMLQLFARGKQRSGFYSANRLFARAKRNFKLSTRSLENECTNFFIVFRKRDRLYCTGCLCMEEKVASYFAFVAEKEERGKNRLSDRQRGDATYGSAPFR